MTNQPPSARPEGDGLLERIELFVDHGSATMGDAQELMSDALLEIKRLTRQPSPDAAEGAGEPILLGKRPVAFRVRRAEMNGLVLSNTEWRLFTNEEEARTEAYALMTDYQGLYVRDGTPLTDPMHQALAEIASLNITPDTGAATAMCMRRLATAAIAAPPKPAPDAMREALAARIEKHSLGWVKQVEGEVSGCSELDACLLEEEEAEIVTALRSSAPVPPADGALCPKCGITLASDETCASIGCPIQGDKPSGIGAAAPDYETAARALGFIKLPTGNWAHPSDGQHMDMTRFYSSAEDIFNRELASPFAVRRDREAIARVVECIVDTCRECRLGKLQANVDYNLDNSRAQCIKFVTDAILSLRVQPGAGEREASADLCAGGVKIGWDECPKCGATMDDECRGEPVEQAPHSSSEDGR